MSEEKDIVERRPCRLGGFAPGNYFCKCVHCGEQFSGDKRAVSCLPCAIDLSDAEITRLRGEVERLRAMVRSIAWRDHDGSVFNAFREDIDLRTQAPGIEDLFPTNLQGE